MLLANLFSITKKGLVIARIKDQLRFTCKLLLVFIHKASSKSLVIGQSSNLLIFMYMDYLPTLNPLTSFTRAKKKIKILLLLTSDILAVGFNSMLLTI